jgi:prephenate dehydrogenase
LAWQAQDQPVTTTWDTVAIVGVGLIGGSIGLALRRGLARRVVGVGHRRPSLEQALARRAVTEVTTDLELGVAEAEVTIICAPVELIPGLVRRVSAACPASAIVSDAGSTKAWIVEQVAAAAVPGQAPFVGSHPLAGSEKQGVVHARADLFEGRTVIVTPTEQTSPEACRRIEEFWVRMGAAVVRLSASQHDQAVAAISHLPHLIAAALAAATPEAFLPLAATGWLDTTRIAAGDVELWRQILRQNRASVLQALEQFERVLNSFALALQQQDDEALTKLLSRGKQQRDALAD